VDKHAEIAQISAIVDELIAGGIIVQEESKISLPKNQERMAQKRTSS
jgi:hypothetical protein